jgi:hypothetical protein
LGNSAMFGNSVKLGNAVMWDLCMRELCHAEELC